MPDINEKIEKAIHRLKVFEPPEGYWLAFSGGKDSQTVYHLAKIAEVRFEAHYSVTSVDPPELVRFIRADYPDVTFDIPRDDAGKPITMWRLIAEKKMPPTRLIRYCCKELKESGGTDRVVITGVRWAESSRRKSSHGIVDFNSVNKRERDAILESGLPVEQLRSNLVLNDDNDENRRAVEMCYRTRKMMVKPIVDWTEEEVWTFLNDVAKVPHCCLYDEGQKRIGCIGCPMAGTR